MQHQLFVNKYYSYTRFSIGSIDCEIVTNDLLFYRFEGQLEFKEHSYTCFIVTKWNFTLTVQSIVVCADINGSLRWKKDYMTSIHRFVTQKPNVSHVFLRSIDRDAQD